MCQIYLSSLVECQALIFPNKQNPTFPLLISPAHAAAHVHFDPRGGGRGGGQAWKSLQSARGALATRAARRKTMLTLFRKRERRTRRTRTPPPLPHPTAALRVALNARGPFRHAVPISWTVTAGKMHIKCNSGAFSARVTLARMNGGDVRRDST